MEEDIIQISIVVPIYNVKKYLHRCIESILGQSYKNMEVILVDDGSTDGCSEICDYYSNLDDRIKVIHKKNNGLVSARKAGTAIATGDYILNVDGDDWIEDDRIEVLVREGIMNAGADMIYMSGYKRDFGESNILMDNNIPLKTFYGNEIKEQVFSLLYNINKVFQINGTHLWEWAMKRELLQEQQKIIDDRVVIGEDVICVWFCLLSANSVTIIKQIGYHYIQRKDSLTFKSVSISEGDDFRMNIWYHQINNYLESKGVSKKIKQMLIFTTLLVFMNVDYGLILKKHEEFLFPFPKIKKGNKIVVYGAGRIGYALMRYLSKSKDYQVMLWVDQNIKRYALPGYSISPVKDIDQVEYDYIAVAVQFVDVAIEIKNVLLQKGIPEEKIALMDASVITEEAIPDEIKKERQSDL